MKITNQKISLIKAELSDLFAEKVIFEQSEVHHYSLDWTRFFEPNGLGVFFPEDTSDVVRIVKWARENKINLVPSGGRTGLSGGACATNLELIVSFDKMNKIWAFNSIEKSICVQAGAITEAIINEANKYGLTFPIDFAAKGSSQIGGNIATNAGGINVIKYGLTRDWIKSLKVVTGTGEVLNLNNSLIKNATGYDLKNLIIGSEGTLAFIIEAELKLCPNDNNKKTLMLSVEKLENILNIYQSFMNLDLLAFEFFDKKSINYVKPHSKDPFPLEDDQSSFYVILDVIESHAKIEEKIIEAFEQCFENGWISDGVISESESQSRKMWHWRENISESITPKSPYKNDISVRISQIPKFIKISNDLFEKTYPDFELVWFGHIGDGNLHINILKPDDLSKDVFFSQCQSSDKKLFEIIESFKGAISAEHGIGLIKKPYLKYTRSPGEITIMKSIKKVFDPDNILNPGKIFD